MSTEAGPSTPSPGRLCGPGVNVLTAVSRSPRCWIACIFTVFESVTIRPCRYDFNAESVALGTNT